MLSLREIFGSLSFGQYSEDKLWRLLQSDQPNEPAILACINAHPKYCSSCRYGIYPIHIAIEKSLSYTTIHKLLECYPQVCMILDSNGNTLLHDALLIVKSTDISKLIMNFYHDAVRIKNDSDNLPLHIECRNQCRYDVIVRLLEIYPESISIENKSEYLPLHLAMKCQYNTSRVILYLISLYPNAVRIVPRQPLHMNGAHHLHFECMNKCRYEVIVKLLDIYPDMISRSCNLDLPLHVALYNDYAQYNVIEHLIKLYPEAVKIVNNENILPIRMIANDPRKYHVISMLIACYPEVVRIPDRYHDFLFKNIFSSYCVALSRYYTKSTYMSIRGYRDVVVEVLDLYPYALHQYLSNNEISTYNKDYRCLLNLANHHISSDKHVQDYRDMNWRVRYSFLCLLMQLLSSTATSYSSHHYVSRISAIDEDDSNSEMNAISYRLLSYMVAAIGRMTNEEVGCNKTVRYGLIKGDDLGCVLLRNILLFL